MDLVVLDDLREKLGFLFGDLGEEVHRGFDLVPWICSASRTVYLQIIDHLLHSFHVRVLQDLVGKDRLKDIVPHIEEVKQLEEVQEL